MKFKEIGSNFSIEKFPNVDIDTNLKDTEFEYYLDTGRSALRLLLDNLKIQKKIVLLPYYICKVVIEPFIEKDYEIYYYDINLDFSIDEKNMFELIDKINPSIILINSYFGKECLNKIREKLKLLNIYVIEDITHTMLNDNLDTQTSNFIIGSIRKWCAIPDGGFLKNNTDTKIILDNIKENSEYVKMQMEAAILKNEYISSLDSLTKEKYMNLFKSSKEILDNDNYVYKMSNISKSLIKDYNFEEIKSIRRKNYNFLYTNLSSKNFIKLPLGEINDKETPLYFPIFIHEKRSEFQKYMSNFDIYLPIIWPKCELLPNNEYIANKIYEEIICIPCDQRYDLNDMKRIIEAINEFERSEIYESNT